MPQASLSFSPNFKVTPENVNAIQTARSHNYSDTEIMMQLMKKNPNVNDEILQAVKNQYKPSDILNYIVNTYPGTRSFGEKTAKNIFNVFRKTFYDIPEAMMGAAGTVVGTGVGGALETGRQAYKGITGKGFDTGQILRSAQQTGQQTQQFGESLSPIPAFGKPIGRATQALGAGVGGLVGGGAEIVQQARRGQGLNLGQIGQIAGRTAAETAQFGQQIGQAGGEAFAIGKFLGQTGRIPPGALGYGLTYTGAQNVARGVRKGKPEQVVSGGAQLILGGLGLKHALSPKTETGLLLKQKIGPPVKPWIARKLGIGPDAEVQAWRDLLNQSKSLIRRQAQWNKDAAQVLQREGVQPVIGKNNRITPEAAQTMNKQLQDRLDPLMEAQRPLIAESGKWVSLDELARAAKNSVKQYKGAGKEYQTMLRSIDDELNSLKQTYQGNITQSANGESLVPASVMNNIATQFQRRAFSGDITKPQIFKDTDFQIGMNARNIVYKSMPKNSPLRDLNAHISELANAQKVIDSRIGSQVVGSNVISRGAARVTGAVIGTAHGDITGGVIGTWTAEKLASALSNPASRINAIRFMINASRSQAGEQLINQATELLKQQAIQRLQTPALGPGPKGGIIYGQSGPSEFRTRETAFPQAEAATRGGAEQVRLPTAQESGPMPPEAMLRVAQESRQGAMTQFPRQNIAAAEESFRYNTALQLRRQGFNKLAEQIEAIKPTDFGSIKDLYAFVQGLKAGLPATAQSQAAVNTLNNWFSSVQQIYGNLLQ